VKFESAAEGFVRQFGCRPALISRAPGRINLLGGHTDYNHGLALPAAIDRHVVLALSPREDGRVRIWSEDFSEGLEFCIGEAPSPESLWQRYVLGALSVFPEDPPSGFDAYFTGDVPLGSGLSSSAALLVAWMNAMRTWTGSDLDDLAICALCQKVEHLHLGVQCGLLDPIGSLCPQPGAVMRVDFSDLSLRNVNAPMDGLSWVVLHTGVHRSLAASAYGQRVEECASEIAALREAHEGVETVRDLSLSMVQGTSVGQRRLRHVLAENSRVESGVAALEAGRPEELGGLLLAAHASLRDDYQVSCIELDTLVEIAASKPGCLGGRMMGGGFGGCTLNLVATNCADSMMKTTLEEYNRATGKKGRGFVVRLVSGAEVQLF